MTSPHDGSSGSIRRRITAALRADEARAFGDRARQQGLLALVTGLLTGLGVAVFERVVAMGMFEHLLDQPLWIQAIMPAVGLALAVAILRTLGRGASSATADEYIKSFHDEDHDLDLRPAPARLLASAATLGGGAAMGYEGPALYLGATIGAWLQSHWAAASSREDNKLLMVCGAAAGVAAIFKAPATGLVFALEVPYRADLARRMLLPAMFASASSYVVFVAVHGTEPLFPIGGTPPFDLRDLGGAVVLGLLAGAGARVFAHGIRVAKTVAVRRSPVVRLPIVAAGLIAAFVATRALTGESLSIGSGYLAIDWALEPGHAVGTIVAIFLLRALATTLAVGGSGVGGLFVPLVVQGALLGAALGGAVHASEPTLFPLLGVAAFLGAGYRVPLAAVVFVAETTGRPGFVVPGLIAAASSQLLMGRSSVTPYQRGTRTSSVARRLALPVTAALRPDVQTIDGDATVAALVDTIITGGSPHALAVVSAEQRYDGMAALSDALAVPRSDWDTTKVAALARTDGAHADLTWTLGDALRALDATKTDELPVVDGGRLVGLISSADILRLDAILDEADRAD